MNECRGLQHIISPLTLEGLLGQLVHILIGDDQLSARSARIAELHRLEQGGDLRFFLNLFGPTD